MKQKLETYDAGPKKEKEHVIAPSRDSAYSRGNGSGGACDFAGIRNRYLLLREELGTIYSDELFADVYPHLGQPAEQPWRLALVTVMQFMENYTDRQAAEAVRTRIDWKYVPPLRVDRPGFPFLGLE